MGIPVKGDTAPVSCDLSARGNSLTHGTYPTLQPSALLPVLWNPPIPRRAIRTLAAER